MQSSKLSKPSKLWLSVGSEKSGVRLQVTQAILDNPVGCTVCIFSIASLILLSSFEERIAFSVLDRTTISEKHIMLPHEQQII